MWTFDSLNKEDKFLCDHMYNYSICVNDFLILVEFDKAKKDHKIYKCDALIFYKKKLLKTIKILYDKQIWDNKEWAYIKIAETNKVFETLNLNNSYSLDYSLNTLNNDLVLLPDSIEIKQVHIPEINTYTNQYNFYDIEVFDFEKWEVVYSLDFNLKNVVKTNKPYVLSTNYQNFFLWKDKIYTVFTPGSLSQPLPLDSSIFFLKKNDLVFFPWSTVDHSLFSSNPQGNIKKAFYQLNINTIYFWSYFHDVLLSLKKSLREFRQDAIKNFINIIFHKWKLLFEFRINKDSLLQWKDNEIKTKLEKKFNMKYKWEINNVLIFHVNYHPLYKKFLYFDNMWNDDYEYYQVFQDIFFLRENDSVDLSLVRITDKWEIAFISKDIHTPYTLNEKHDRTNMKPRSYDFKKILELYWIKWIFIIKDLWFCYTLLENNKMFLVCFNNKWELKLKIDTNLSILDSKEGLEKCLSDKGKFSLIIKNWFLEVDFNTFTFKQKKLQDFTDSFKYTSSNKLKSLKYHFSCYYSHKETVQVDLNYQIVRIELWDINFINFLKDKYDHFTQFDINKLKTKRDINPAGFSSDRYFVVFSNKGLVSLRGDTLPKKYLYNMNKSYFVNKLNFVDKYRIGETIPKTISINLITWKNCFLLKQPRLKETDFN